MCAVVVRGRQYLVLKGHGKWFVKSLGRLGVPYSSEVRAIRGAVDRAQKSGRPWSPCSSNIVIQR
ncbi:MAG: hypothetical protein WCE32_00790, partial [Pseudolabrys sp.]